MTVLSRAVVSLAVSFVLAASAASPAVATDAEPQEPGPALVAHAPPRTAVYMLTGFGTPVGVVGFEGVRRFVDSLEISAGFGLGLGAATNDPHPTLGGSLQWAVMQRYRLGNERHAFTFGVGLSGGNYGGQWGSTDWIGPPPPPVTYVFWGNVELGGEFWSTTGLAFRAFLGGARGCPAHGPCGDRTAHEAPLWLPYTGIGLGYAF
jgi:hypothetical protein